MDKIKRLILLAVPMSICNFRCSYCYLTHREEYYQNKQPDYQYSPDHVAKALSKKRLGGASYINVCADGETMLATDIDLYVKALLEEGHYVEFITNLTVTNVLDKMLSWDRDLLKRLEFKCSFHYLQLKKKGWLDRYAANVHKIWAAGASANIEITPSDDLIPYLEEVKSFSMEHFGALPHLSIARNDNSVQTDYLTELPMDKYDAIWSTFGSSFWSFKKTIFKNKRTEFCYAGDWSLYIDLASGQTKHCYSTSVFTNVFDDISSDIPFKAIGKCPEPHCYNGHMFLTLGCIPDFTEVKYGEIRNRIKSDGGEWLQPELKAFFNSHLVESNEEYTSGKKNEIMLEHRISLLKRLPGRIVNKLTHRK